MRFKNILVFLIKLFENKFVFQQQCIIICRDFTGGKAVVVEFVVDKIKLPDKFENTGYFLPCCRISRSAVFFMVYLLVTRRLAM